MLRTKGGNTASLLHNLVRDHKEEEEGEARRTEREGRKGVQTMWAREDEEEQRKAKRKEVEVRRR
jgi:hypothetical protein